MWVVTEAKMRVSSGTRNSWNDSNESSNDHIPLGRVVTRRHRGQDVQRGSNAGGCEDQSWAHAANVLVQYTLRAGYGCSSWAARRDSMKFVRHP